MLPEEVIEEKEDVMECPFCKNEIKKWAIKCQFCKSLLDNEEVKKEVKKGKQSEKKNNLNWLYRVLFVIILITFFSFLFEQKDNQSQYKNREKMNKYYDNVLEMMDSTWDKNIEDITNLINQQAEWTDQYYKDITSKISDFFVSYYEKMNSLDVLGLDDYSQINDKTLINKIISNWKSYKEHQEKWLELVSELSNDPKYGWDSYDPRDKYTTRDSINEMNTYFSNLSKFADTNIELYSYLYTLSSNEYYVDWDGNIYFYDEFNLNKFNDLITKQSAWFDEYEKTIEQHNNYTKNRIEYNKSLLNK